MRSATQPYCNTVEYGCVSLRMQFFSQNFGTIKRILPRSSLPSHREGPGIEVGIVGIKFDAWRLLEQLKLCFRRSKLLLVCQISCR